MLIEVGPVTIRRAGEPLRLDPEIVEAALDGIDEQYALVDEQPVRADELWRDLLGGLDSGDRIVHPSWWPQRRLDRLHRATAGEVPCVRRCEVIAEHDDAVPVIEVDREVITVYDGEMRVFDRRDVDAVVAATGGAVSLDVPAGVCGTDLREELRRRGIDVRDADLGRLCAPAPGDAPPRRRPRAVLAAVAVALVAAAGLTWRHHPGHPGSAPQTAALVEGRVAMAVPSQWTVRRVTGGPGSRRVEVSAPDDAGAVLHLTWSYVPESTLATAAETLGRAAAAQPAGVFTGVRIATVAGREAVTYTETRPGRLVRWSVLLDGATRISIGCQSPPEAQETVRQACEQAIRSAHEVTGTEAGR